MSLDRWIDTRMKCDLEFEPKEYVTRIWLKGKMIGWINRGEKTFYTVRNREKHYFRKFKGWGVSKQLVHVLLRQQINTLRIMLPEEKKLETVRTSLFLRDGANYEHGDYERQLVLPESSFTVEEKK